MNHGSSEQFQLHCHRSCTDMFCALKNLHLSELLVGHGKDSYLAPFGYNILDPTAMNFGTLARLAVADIDRKLKHGESVAKQLLAEQSIRLALLLGLGRHIKEYENPHDAIFTEAVGNPRHDKLRVRDNGFYAILPLNI